ncbi:MAG: permease [Victivallales bacterium]|jgi:uncharacterized membrane protein YraQ (UPF0718 family)/copper chaperone CopZ|nr:permease [Victivallales bacterium]
MFDIVENFLFEFWNISCLMAPWLLFGFLIGGVIAVFIPDAFIKKHLGGKGFAGIIKASLIGVPLPLCSCGVIPVAATLKRQGAGGGTIASFITSTPQIGFSSFIPAWQLIGAPLAVIKAVFAFVTGTLVGVLINIFCPATVIPRVESPDRDGQPENSPYSNKLVAMLKYAFGTLMGDVGGTLMFGLAISALIGALLPADFAARYAANTMLVVPVMILVSLPMYVCTNAAIPIAATLLMKGFTPGAALAFLIAGPSCSAPMIAAFWKLLGRRAAFVYIALMMTATLMVCWGVDYFHSAIPGLKEHTMAHHDSRSWVEITCAILMFVILIYNFIAPYCRKSKETLTAGDGQILLQVDDMTCTHCLQSVTGTVNSLHGVRLLKADIAGRKILLEAPQESRSAIIELLRKSGFNAH